MTKKYHIGKDGPAVCNATVRACPIGGEHFENERDAEATYAKKMGGTFQVKTFAPPKPYVEPPTLDEINEVLGRVHKHFENSDFLRSPVIDGNVVSYTLLGSGLYGLNHPDSDRDILVVTDQEKGVDVHKVFDDGTDIRITSVFRLASNFMISRPNDVDVIRSKKLIFKENKYEQYYNSLRFDKLLYLSRIGQHGRKEMKRTVETFETNRKKADKNMKSGLRGYFIHAKIERDGVDFTTEFSQAERENFYRSFDTLKKARDSGATAEQLEKIAYEDALSSAFKL